MPPFPYNNNVPLTPQAPSDTQEPIRQNFESIQNWVEVDHSTFSSGNAGKHNKVSLVQQAADPVTDPEEMALYTKDVGGTTQLFLANENGGDIYNITQSTKNSTGYTVFPSGIIVKWGGTATISNGATVTMNQGPAFTTLYNVQVTAQGSNADRLFASRVQFGAGTANQFALYFKRVVPSIAFESTDFRYVAIGV